MSHTIAHFDVQQGAKKRTTKPESLIDEIRRSFLGRVVGFTPTRTSTQAFLAARGGGAGGETDPFSAIADALRASQAAQSTSDAANRAFQEEIARQQLAQEQRKIELAEREQAFTEKDVLSQRGLEAAGLATGPAGALQLLFAARGEGAPNEQIRSLLQNLPFLRAILAGQALPIFGQTGGIPEQLGGETGRLDALVALVTGGQATRGGTFGTVLPALTGLTEQQFRGLSRLEQATLGALFQTETGLGAEDALSRIRESFIPTLGSFGAI